jgi:RNase H-fold protein (predicted Holliday junction resolvase)
MQNKSARVETVLAIDPGREKCGVAVVDGAGAVAEQCIVARGEVVAFVEAALKRHGVRVVVLGHATSSASLRSELEIVVQRLNATIFTIDETGSTLEARALYWKKYPPRGLKKLLPLSAQMPPVPLDDFAAIVLAHRFLSLEK